VKPGKIAKKTAPKAPFRARLIFDMNDEERRNTLELDFDYEVGLQSFTRSYVGENLLVHELNGSGIEIRKNLGKKQIEKLDKKSADQFFKETVVISHFLKPHTMQIGP